MLFLQPDLDGTFVDDVFIRVHRDDPDMLELYSVLPDGEFVVWGCVASDFINFIRGDVTYEALANNEFILKAVHAAYQH